MQQLIQFLINNFTKILFAILLMICFSIIFINKPFQRSKFINASNSFTGYFYDNLNEFKSYFTLKDEMDELKNENILLKRELFKNDPDNTSSNIKSYRGFDIVQARIINNSYSTYENYLTLNAGKNKNIEPEMGVMNSNGIIGVVEYTLDNFSSVISILNINSKINAKLKNSEHFGWITWNGKNTGFVQLIDMPRLALVKNGDTIVTGTHGVFFPEGQNIGTVHKIYNDGETNYYTIDVKLFNDMTKLKNVFVIKNRDKKEIQMIEKIDSLQSTPN